MRAPRLQRRGHRESPSSVKIAARRKALPAAAWHRELLVAAMLRTSIKLQTHMDRLFRARGMTDQEASVLLRIVEARRITPGALAHSLGRDKGKVTRFIQCLAACNLIRRKVKAQDRRVAQLEPTSRGRARASQLKVVFDELRDDLFRGVSTEREKQVADILLALLSNLNRGGQSVGEDRGV